METSNKVIYAAAIIIVIFALATSLQQRGVEEPLPAPRSASLSDIAQQIESSEQIENPQKHAFSPIEKNFIEEAIDFIKDIPGMLFLPTTAGAANPPMKLLDTKGKPLATFTYNEKGEIDLDPKKTFFMSTISKKGAAKHFYKDNLFEAIEKAGKKDTCNALLLANRTVEVAAYFQILGRLRVLEYGKGKEAELVRWNLVLTYNKVVESCGEVYKDKFGIAITKYGKKYTPVETAEKPKESPSK
ncbi:hypothetical protein ACFLZZ_03915 [Nanoarchaeota archaeon]